MESMIGVCIQTIKAINTIISGLRSTLDLVESIKLESAHLGRILEALHRTSETRVLSDADMKDWLEQQRTCNKTLRKIEDILEDYARGSTSRVSILRDAKFQFGPKGELSRLRKDLKTCIEYFCLFDKVIRPDTGSRLPPQQQQLHSSPKQESVMSIHQFVQMRAGLDQVGL